MVLSRLVNSRTHAAVLMLILTGIYVLLQLTAIHMTPIWYNSVFAFPVGVLCAAQIDGIQKYNNTGIGLVLILVFILSHVAYFLVQRTASTCAVNVAPLFQVMASLAFALDSIRLVSRINIRNRVLESIGNYSLSVLIAHQVLVVYVSSISNVFIYVLVVLMGTFSLTWVYSRIHRMVFSRNK